MFIMINQIYNMRKNVQTSHLLWLKFHDFHVHLTRTNAVHLVDLVSEFLGADRRHSFEDIHTLQVLSQKRAALAYGSSAYFCPKRYSCRTLREIMHGASSDAKNFSRDGIVTFAMSFATCA